MKFRGIIAAQKFNQHLCRNKAIKLIYINTCLMKEESKTRVSSKQEFDYKMKHLIQKLNYIHQQGMQNDDSIGYHLMMVDYLQTKIQSYEKDPRSISQFSVESSESLCSTKRSKLEIPTESSQKVEMNDWNMFKDLLINLKELNAKSSITTDGRREVEIVDKLSQIVNSWISQGNQAADYKKKYYQLKKKYDKFKKALEK